MTLQEVLAQMEADVDKLVASMAAEGVSAFQQKYTEAVLKPALTGVIVAHAGQTPLPEIEQTIADTFCSVIMELIRRTHRQNPRTRAKADEAAVHVEQILREMADQLSTFVEEDYAPKIALVKPH